MMKRRKINTILISSGIAATAIVFILSIFPQFWSAYPCSSSCTSVESDANEIASMIADYFSIPTRTEVKPGDLDGGFQTENLWTINQCGNEVYIYVYDVNEDCPIDYQEHYPEWNSGIYTKIMD